jgi:hypothetical protein
MEGGRPVENCGNRKAPLTLAFASFFQACSACAGDYEDPDRTAASDEHEAGGVSADEEGFCEP